jgi:hypothetical protein
VQADGDAALRCLDWANGSRKMGIPIQRLGEQEEMMADPAAPESDASAATPEVSAAARIKEKRPTQRACDEKNEKGKLCCGHLKRWYDYPPEIGKLIGKKAEIYRCEFCQTLYKPDLAEMPHSYTLRY